MNDIQKKPDYSALMGQIESFSLRIDAAKHKKLKELAASMNLKLVDLGRIAVDGLLDYAEAQGGKLTLPINFTNTTANYDALLEQVTKKMQNMITIAAEDKTPYNVTNPSQDADEEKLRPGGNLSTG